MRYFSAIVLTALAVFFLTAAPAPAGNKFKNVDTAKDRQDNTFGTNPREGGTDITVEKNDRGDTVVKSTPAPKEEVDWYEKTDMKLHMDLEKNIDDE